MFDTDNPMVVLGYPQGSRSFFDHLACTHDGDEKMDMGVAVDPRDLKIENFEKLFPDVDEYDRETMFAEMKKYGKTVLMNLCFSNSEKGNVNNCPFGEDGVNSEYKIDIGAINAECEGL